MAETELIARTRPVAGQIRSVQSLRAIAALFVVVFHSTVLWHDEFTPSVVPWQNGNAGVDLFFVISGFIMVLSSRRLLHRADGWRRFLVLRLVRITPMYWLVTAAKLAIILVLPEMVVQTRPTAWNIVASFLFLPARDAVGIIKPVIDVGWTLSFEMLFYAVFAFALFSRIEAVLVVGPAMLLLALVSNFREASWPAITTLANPIVLEFVFGILIAHALLSRWRKQLSSPWMLVLAVVGLCCLALVRADGEWQRVSIWGVAAAVTLSGCVFAELWIDRYLPNLLVEVGEASYSIYLTHGFLLPVIGLLVAELAVPQGAIGAALIVTSVIASIVVGLLVYRRVEAPMTLWLRELVGDRARVSPASPEAPI